jgi:hypothetical protein
MWDYCNTREGCGQDYKKRRKAVKYTQDEAFPGTGTPQINKQTHAGNQVPMN